MFDSRGHPMELILFPAAFRQGRTRLATDKGRQAVMHRIRRASFRTAVLTLLILVGVLTGHGQPAAASDRSPASETAFPAAGGNTVLNSPYLSAGVALTRSQDTRFVDGEDSGHAALYGNEELFDAGALGNALQFQLALGARLPYQLRAQLELGLASELDWKGNTNYPGSGGHQPSEARLDIRQLLLAGFHDFPGWEIAPGRRARPYLGAGLGITDYRLSGYVQRFPEPDDSQSYLRRGPGGEIPFTALPGGSGQNFTWMLTAGIAIPISGSTVLDLSYRYTDAGEIQTDIGDIAVVRYREDGTRREIPIPINETSADYRIHSILVALRFQF